MSRFEKYYGPDFNSLEKQDPEIAAVVISELVRQRQDVQLIASENFTSSAVLAAMGSTLSNKYAEGYPGKRYYGGCEEVDKVCLLYTSPSPRDLSTSRMPSSA